MKTGLIYKITNNTTKHSYVGKTTRTLEVRWKEHIRDSKNPKKDTVLGRAIKKHGSHNFTIEIIVNNVPILFLDTFEKYWIHFYNTFKGIGYNCTEGGDGTSKVPSWNKGKTGIYSKETLEKMRNAKLGVKPTNLEQLRELAKARTGKSHQNAKAVNIYAYKTNILVAENTTIAEWCRKHDQNPGNLASTARGTALQCKGFYAKYL